MLNKLKVIVHTHHFVVTSISPRTREAVEKFARRNVQFGFIKVGRQFRRAPLKVFAAATKDRNEYSFHINQLTDFKEALKLYFLTEDHIDYSDAPLVATPKVELPIFEQWVTREDQVPVVDYLMNEEGPRQKFVNLQTGKGKAQPLDAKIRIPGGWTTMGKIKVGDEVIAADGTVAKVTHIHPQGVKDIYVITFADGREAECCLDHLWRINIQNHWEIVSTKDLMLNLTLGHDQSIQLIKPCPTTSGRVESLIQKFLDRGMNSERSGLLRLKVAGKEEAAVFQEEIWSLGGICHIKSDGYVDFSIAEQSDARSELTLGITSVDFSRQAEAQCITVDHPDHLYVTNNYVVTHNSYTTMRSISNLGAMQMIIVKPMYIDKWVIDIKKTYDIADDELMCVRGSANLKALLELATMGELKVKVIIMSNKTLQNWIKLYEQFRDNIVDMGYACTPRQLFQHLGVGVRVIDEVHQDFHLNFKIDLYTHVERGISLSATLLSDDEFMNRMYEIAYPKRDRYNGGAFDRYIRAKALLYRINNPDSFKCVDWATKRYSHNIFEQSIMKSPPRLANYTKLIIQAIESSYEKDYKSGNRLIIFCASIAFCTYLTNELKKRYPNRDVRRYVEEDPYENLMEADIRVTTLLSAGTAVDIPNLKTTILTVAVSSSQSNVQGLGRLRKLSDGQDPDFIYFVAENIPKHVEYHTKKRELLKPRTKSYGVEDAFMIV